MEKQRCEESRRRRQEVRRSEKRKREKKEDAGAQKGRKVAIHFRKRPFAAVVASKLPCLWEKSQKCDFFDVSEDVVLSFGVAGVALRDIPTCFTTLENRFLWQARYFCHVFTRCVAIIVAGAAL